ncbi:hypothetical protein [Flagellimonas meridianipacifica]|uniref:Lipocalin-like protein n=1 Tax=Flagellimonas meridianipacifica TaxID=1080225 RepID=A0A2T0MBW0_9FLAO|nr:hypothetical protein [Allomuricauda pacifica]PRX54989.1 hypothetical protein CLV81_3395 [Allomuricauda pacifica]
MKSFSLRIVFVLLIVLTNSCNLDDGVEQTPLPNFEVIGLWDLVEVNINPPQDLNMDGTASANLMDELECITGSLLIDGNLVWTFEQSDIAITTITGDMFSADCNGTITGTGSWFSDETEVTFSGNDDILTGLRISGDQLVNDIGEDLPGIQSFVYELRQP